MKSLWIKYIFASVLVAALSVVLYQQFGKNDYVTKVPSSGESSFGQLSQSDVKIKNFDTVELNRAAFIAQKEQELSDDIDVDIPVVYEQYDQPFGHVPEKKINKVAIQPYDPNAGLSVDRSGGSAFSQMPVESGQMYPEQPSFYPPSLFDEPYYPGRFANNNRSDSSKSFDKPSKKSVEESPMTSRIEYPEESKNPAQGEVHGYQKPSLQHRTSDVNKNHKPSQDTKLKNDTEESKDDAKKIEEKPDDQNSDSDDASKVSDEDESGWFKNFIKKLLDRWNKNKPDEGVPVAAEVYLPDMPKSEVILKDKDVEPEGIVNLLSGNIQAPEPEIKPQGPVNPSVLPSEPIKPLSDSGSKQFVSYDQSVRPVRLQESQGKPAEVAKILEKPETQAKNVLPKLSDNSQTPKRKELSDAQKIQELEVAAENILSFGKEALKLEEMGSKPSELPQRLQLNIADDQLVRPVRLQKSQGKSAEVAKIIEKPETQAQNVLPQLSDNLQTAKRKELSDAQKIQELEVAAENILSFGKEALKLEEMGSKPSELPKKSLINIADDQLVRPVRLQKSQGKSAEVAKIIEKPETQAKNVLPKLSDNLQTPKRKELSDPQKVKDLTERIVQSGQPDLSAFEQAPKTRRLTPTRIVAVRPTVEMSKAKETGTVEPIMQAKKELSPQEQWELKNKEKLLQQAQEKLKRAQQELEKLSTDELEKREALEREEFWANKALQAELEQFEIKMKELKADQEKKLNLMQTDLQELETQETFDVEKEKPLSKNEIQKITSNYENLLMDKYHEWKKEHINSTMADFIDFELGFEGKQPLTKNFTQAIEKNLGADFKKYNKVTQDLILRNLEQGFFNMSGQNRKSPTEWEYQKAADIKNKVLINSRSFVRQRTEQILKNSGITRLNSNDYDEILDSIVPQNSLQSPTAYSDDEIKEKISEFLTNKDQVVLKDVQKIPGSDIDVAGQRDFSEYPSSPSNRLPKAVYPSSQIALQDVQILQPENIEALSEPTVITEVEFLEPTLDQINQTSILQIPAGNKIRKNKFLQGATSKQKLLTPGFQDPRVMISEQKQSIAAKSVTPQASSHVKTRRLTDEEEIARDMQNLKLRQAEEFNAIPYEMRSEADPFGQKYLYKNPVTLEEIVGVAEEIEEYLQNLPILQKAQLKISHVKDYLKDQYKNAPDEYKPLQSSEENVQPYEKPMTDEQRAEQAIEQLFGGPDKPITYDVTKGIVPEPSSGHATLADTASKMSSEVAALASGSGSVRIPA